MLILSVLVVTFNNLDAQTRELIIQHRKFQGEYKSLLPVGYGPSDIQLNVKTNKIYVANSGSNTVSVIDSDSGNRKTIRVGAAPTSIAVDEILNKIYVTNSGSNSVSVIDGYTDNKTRDIYVPAPRIMAADKDDHKIYVSSTYGGNSSIAVIDAKNDTKIKDISFGDQTPVKIMYYWPAVTVLTQVRGNGTLSTIDPQQNDRLNLDANKIPVGPEPMDMAVGYNTSGFHKIYVINRWPDDRNHMPYTTSMVSVVHSSATRHDMDYLYDLDRSHRFDINLGHKPAPLSFLLGQTKAAVKTADREPCCNHGLVYATNSDNSVSIINMTTDTLLHDVLLPWYPSDIALGNVSKDTRYPKVYVANGAFVSIINGTAKARKDIPVGISPTRIAYNPAWNMIYVLGYTPHTPMYLDSKLRNGSVSVIDGATDKVAEGVIFNVNPANSGNITCNNEVYPTNTYIYVDSGTNCKVQNNNGFDFINWVELTNRNASIPLEPSSSDPENLIVDRYGVFTANFKQERPLSADQLFTYLTGAISAAVAINGALLVVPGWRRARNQRAHLRECIQMIDNDAGKSHKDAIEEKIIGYYVDGKLSEDHRQLLNDKISEYYGSVKDSESDA